MSEDGERRTQSHGRAARRSRADSADVVRWALIGTTLSVIVTLIHVRVTGLNVLNLLQPGTTGPSARIILHDFPGATLPPGDGYDGQQFYAIARQPMHWHALVASLDRPLYRLERPLFPWLGWMLHPSGGGNGLIAALFVIGVVALLTGGIVVGRVATEAGRSPRWAALYPLLPGAALSLRTTTADALATSLALFALWSARKSRLLCALAGAIAAALAKEVLLAVLVGNAFATRTREAIMAAIAGSAAFIAFWATLSIIIGSHSTGVVDLSLPFVGAAGAIRHWAGGHDLLAAASGLVCLGVTVAAASRAWTRSRNLLWILAATAGYLTCLRADPLELNLGGPRTYLPLTAVASVLILQDARRVSPSNADRSAAGALHRGAHGVVLGAHGSTEEGNGDDANQGDQPNE